MITTNSVLVVYRNVKTNSGIKMKISRNTNWQVSHACTKLYYTSVHIALVATNTSYQVYNELKEILGYNSQSVGRVIMHNVNYLQVNTINNWSE